MFIITKFSKRLLIVMSVSVLAIVFIFVMSVVFPKPGSKSASADIDENNTSEIIEFLKEYGWETDETPVEIRQVVIPAEFDSVYETYNKMQKSQGFDLEKYKNKKVQRYTFNVSNYPGGEENVRANVLVSNGEIIGGDICTLKLDGFMHGFNKDKTGVVKQTFYMDTEK